MLLNSFNKSLFGVCFLFFTNFVSSQGIINNVSFDFNDSWQKNHDPEILDSAASIGYRYLGDSSFSFRVEALIRINYVPKVISIDNMQIDYFAEAIGMAKVITAIEGDDWKSSILVANEEGSQHIAFHRMGVRNGVVLELMLFFENKGEGNTKVLTMKKENVIGQMSGLVVDESLGKEMISIYHEISKTLEIYKEKEASFSLTLIDPPKKPSKVFRPAKN